MAHFISKSLNSICFKKVPGIFKLTLCNHSTLIIPGNKASESFAFLTPYLDLDKRFNNIELQEEFLCRGIQIDVKELQKKWEYYKYVNLNKKLLEQKKSRVSIQLSALVSKKNLPTHKKHELEALQSQSKILKQDLKMIKEALWALENDVIKSAFKLPNDISNDTPFNVPVILSTAGEKPSEDNILQNHLEIGKKLGLLQYVNSFIYYLSDEAVLFEFRLVEMVSKILKNENFLKICGSDFSRSIVVEGSGLDHESSLDSFILQDSEVSFDKNMVSNRLHLTGNASLSSFLAMVTKQVLNPNDFPVRFFASGRNYMPFSQNYVPFGLFTVSQASAIHVFTLIQELNSSLHENELKSFIDTVSKIYNELGCHYRTVLRSAKELHPSESLRISFEMWSVYFKQYIEIGNISAYGDYFSKRLLITYQTPSGKRFPCTISGTILNIPRILACLLEQSPDKFKIPKCLN